MRMETLTDPKCVFLLEFSTLVRSLITRPGTPDWRNILYYRLITRVTAVITKETKDLGFCRLPLQLKMVLIKCCDISNEVRPMEVAEPWVDCLLEEYFMQVGPRWPPGGLVARSPPGSPPGCVCVCVLPERPGEDRGASCGALHGQGEGHQAHGSDRLHQVRAHPHV